MMTQPQEIFVGFAQKKVVGSGKSGGRSFG